MNRSTILSIKKIAACAMGIMVLFVVTFSALFVLMETDHDCQGEDCPVCACIVQCQKTLGQIAYDDASQANMAQIVLLFCIPVCLLASFIASQTPVSRKIRLND